MANAPANEQTVSRRMRVRPRPLFAVLALAVLLSSPSAVMAQGRLGSAKQFGVLGAEAVTNTGPTTIKGDLGVHPGESISGRADITLIGSDHLGDAVALQAQIDAMNAYNGLAAMTITNVLTGQDLGNRTLTPGVYFFASSAQLTGPLILDFQGNANAQFVFQIGSTLTTASGSTVSVINGGPTNGVYWQVGSSATLGTGSVFAGNIIALESVTLTTSAKILCGRAIALTGAVTLDNNVISNDCAAGGDFGTEISDFGSAGYSGGLVAVVPEPATLLLVGTGLTGLAAAWRRRRRTSVGGLTPQR